MTKISITYNANPDVSFDFMRMLDGYRTAEAELLDTGRVVLDGNEYEAGNLAEALLIVPTATDGATAAQAGWQWRAPFARCAVCDMALDDTGIKETDFGPHHCFRHA